MVLNEVLLSFRKEALALWLVRQMVTGALQSNFSQAAEQDDLGESTTCTRFQLLHFSLITSQMSWAPVGSNLTTDLGSQHIQI